MNNTTTKDRLLFAGLFALALVLGIVSDRKEQPKTAEDFEPSPFVEVMVAEEGTGVKLIRSDEWAEQYPDQYATYIMNDENSEVVDYIAENPYIKTLYEGFGFAVSYGSARRHTY
ncbi:MAG: ammonia-forming cytochrome c nitrite reductase subunit c552, partial [Solobacterium sp.]|nr:ammonia-forming cytochrome c nitrite reductase subunit c552 [Solobacterium sp.]